MWDGNAHVGFSVHHFRAPLPANPHLPQRAQPRPLKVQAVLPANPRHPPPPRASAAAAPFGL